MDKEKDIEEIKERISRKYPSINIGRVPPKTFDFFTQLAKEEFCDDRGMVLKSLCDFYQGLVPVGDEHIQMEIQLLRDEINQLKKKVEEQKDEKKETPTRKMLSGKGIEK